MREKVKEKEEKNEKKTSGEVGKWFWEIGRRAERIGSKKVGKGMAGVEDQALSAVD